MHRPRHKDLILPQVNPPRLANADPSIDHCPVGRRRCHPQRKVLRLQHRLRPRSRQYQQQHELHRHHLHTTTTMKAFKCTGTVHRAV